MMLRMNLISIKKRFVIPEIAKRESDIPQTPEINQAVAAAIQSLSECSIENFRPLANKIKATLSENDFIRLLKEKQALLKILSLSPEVALDIKDCREKYSMIGQNWIYECGCLQARNKKCARQNLVETLSQVVEKYFASSGELSIMSLGTGGCFQELVIHSVLVEKFKINWILVEPTYLDKTNKTYEEFARLIKTMSDNSTSSHIKNDADALLKLRNKICPPPDLILSIDSRLGQEFNGQTDESGKPLSRLDVFRDAVVQLRFPHVWAILEKEEPEFYTYL